MKETKVFNLGKELTAAEILEILAAVAKPLSWRLGSSLPEINRQKVYSTEKASGAIPLFTLNYGLDEERTGYTEHAYLSPLDYRPEFELQFFVNCKQTEKITQLRFADRLGDTVNDTRKKHLAEASIGEFLRNFGITCLLYEGK